MSPEPVAARLGSYSHLDTLRSDSGPSTELSLPSRLIRESVWYLAALPVVAAIAEALPVCYAWDTVDGVVIPLGDVGTASVTDLHNHLQGCWGPLCANWVDGGRPVWSLFFWNNEAEGVVFGGLTKRTPWQR